MSDLEEYEVALKTLKKAQKHVLELALIRISDPSQKNPAILAAFDVVINYMHDTVSEWSERDRFLRKKYEA